MKFHPGTKEALVSPFANAWETMREHPRQIVGFTALFLWSWLFLQDSYAYQGFLNTQSGFPYPWTISTILFSVTFMIIGIASYQFEFTLSGPKMLLSSLACLALGAGCIAYPMFFSPSRENIVIFALVGGVLTGIATPVFYLEMVRFYLGLRLTTIITIGALCTALASAFYWGGSLLTSPAVAPIIMALPFVMFACLWPARTTFTPTIRDQTRGIYVPWKLNVTAFVQGLCFEAGRLFAAHQGDGGWIASSLNPLYILGYAASAVVLIAIMALMRRRFDTLIYKIGFPLLAFGTLILPVIGLESEGHLLAAFGYRFVDILVWSLVIYLTLSKKVPLGWLAGWSTCCLYLGMATGQLFIYSIMDSGSVNAPQFAMSLVAFVTVLTALLVSSATNDEKAWGSLRPLEDEPTRPHLSEAISDLASMYGLTQRQVEVLDGLSRGKTKSEIADDLCISVETVRVHARRIYAALGIHSIAELNRIVNAQEKTRADQFEK